MNRKCATATFIKTHDFLWTSDEGILKYGQKIREKKTIFRTMNAGKLFLISWTIVTMFMVMAFNCNLRAYLVKIEFNDPIGRF